MEDIDTAQLAEVLHRVLGHRNPHDLAIDVEGWVAIEDVCVVASEAMQRPVVAEHLVILGRRARSFEIRGMRIRIQRKPRLPSIPDILFHATTASGVERVRTAGELTAPFKRRLYLSEDEEHAWRIAHRLEGPPRLLVVDAIRARRAGVRFQRARQPGLFAAAPVPLRHVLNLREGYGEQWSAGGIPVRRTPDGKIAMALIQVTRRSGTTWEVAKGKLEPAETPEDAAVREVREEMGISCGMRILRHVGDVRYGFLAPGGVPRLKTIFLYLMEPVGEMGVFDPASAEGIGDVRWFPVEEAVHAVTHTSLQPLMWRARDLLARYGLSPARDLAP